MTVQVPAREPDTVTLQILEEVADVHGVDPVALSPPLASVVDPDALDAIVRSSASAEIEFSYAGCDVLVTGDAIDVTPRAQIA